MRILVVENDEFTARALIAALAHQNYVIELATDKQLAWELLESFPFDLIVLDVSAPELEGLELCRRVRSHDYSMPILVLTNHSNGHEAALGLDAGADDCVVKPFDLEELEARIRALLRRGTVNIHPILSCDELTLNPSTHDVCYAEKPLTLTPKEYALLELFLRNQQRVFSCALILEQVWTYEEIPGEDAVRTHIKGLRQKLKAVGAPTDLIETVYGIGYRLNPKLLATGRKPTPKPVATGAGATGTAPTETTETAEVSPAAHNQQIRQQTLNAIANVLDRFKHNRPTVQTAEPPKPANPVAKVMAPPLAPPGITTTAKILLISDDASLLRSLQTLLAPWGLSISRLHDPTELWGTLAQFAPDLVILDASVNTTAAIQSCQAIRDDDRWSYVPVMILTADTDATTVNQLFSVGADDFVSKPIVGPELITRIINRLERVRLLRRLSERCPIAQIDPKMVCPFQPDRFFNLSQDLLCTVGLDGNFRRLNPAFEKTLGYHYVDLLNQPFLKFVHPDDHSKTAAEFDKALKGSPIINFENRYRCKDGTYKALSWHSVPGLEEGVIYAIAHDLSTSQTP